LLFLALSGIVKYMVNFPLNYSLDIDEEPPDDARSIFDQLSPFGHVVLRTLKNEEYFFVKSLGPQRAIASRKPGHYFFHTPRVIGYMIQALGNPNERIATPKTFGIDALERLGDLFVAKAYPLNITAEAVILFERYHLHNNYDLPVAAKSLQQALDLTQMGRFTGAQKLRLMQQAVDIDSFTAALDNGATFDMAIEVYAGSVES
jgi:hypothetical protein